MENVSHGCVNLSAQDAQAYFQTAIYGDPVEVTGPASNSRPRTATSTTAIPEAKWTTLAAN